MLINPEFTIGTFRKEIHGNELYLFNAKGELENPVERQA